MNPTAHAHLDAFVEKYRTSGPPSWIRIVSWSAHLADEDGTVDRGTLMQTEVAIVLTPAGIASEHFAGDPQASFDLDDMDAALEGEPEAGWTILRLEIDRGGSYRADFDTGPARPMLDSATDPYWDAVHNYADLHRGELEELVERLRSQGDLPEPADPRGGESGGSDTRSGRLGRMFGRR